MNFVILQPTQPPPPTPPAPPSLYDENYKRYCLFSYLPFLRTFLVYNNISQTTKITFYSLMMEEQFNI
ncbi:hypothetical protein DERF_003436 [Dermatophagoides farinae]|uniref:Uncharacterized protein n=1 Tax=Dermatophagoides farinae TaxID=6954 RepID=A0A922IEQ3_DERFA|nr:hypothetical protein DERF_003436 [Dermatophagoides farinae]